MQIFIALQANNEPVSEYETFPSYNDALGFFTDECLDRSDYLDNVDRILCIDETEGTVKNVTVELAKAIWEKHEVLFYEDGIPEFLKKHADAQVPEFERSDLEEHGAF